MNRFHRLMIPLLAAVAASVAIFPAQALTIDEQVRAIAREEIAAALKALPTNPVVTPPVVTPTPVAPSGSNPFVAWKAEGRDLWWIQTFGLQHGLSAAEWDLAVAAGYPRENGLQRTGGLDYTGFDLTGLDDGNFKRQVLMRGSYTFTWRPGAGASSGYFNLVEGVQATIPLPLAANALVSITDDSGHTLVPTYSTGMGNVVATPRFAISPGRSYFLSVTLDGNMNLAVEPRTR